jgi:predicted nuclease with TOPRIM domain
LRKFIIKFKSLDLAKTILTKALLNNDYRAFKQLFDIQDDHDFTDNYDEFEQSMIQCNVYDIPKLPNYTDLRSLFLQSMEVFEQDAEEARELLKTTKNSSLRKVAKFSEKEYMTRVEKFDKLYQEYTNGENIYYDVL